MKKRNKIKLKILSFLSLLSLCLMTLFSGKTYAYEEVFPYEYRSFLNEGWDSVNVSLYPTIDNNNRYTIYQYDYDDTTMTGDYIFYSYITSLIFDDSYSDYNFLNIGLFFTSNYYSSSDYIDCVLDCHRWIYIDDIDLYYNSRYNNLQLIFDGHFTQYFYLIFEYRVNRFDFDGTFPSIFNMLGSFPSNDDDFTNNMISSYRSQINEANNTISSLSNQIANLNLQITSQQNLIDNLNATISRQSEQIRNFNQYNAPQLIWTIATTPFESFKQIWNVDLLGLNLANFVIGLCSALIIIYIIKKIF